MKCKNTECVNEVKPNRTYCSLTCRNVYVNKHLRTYDKLKKLRKERKIKKIEEYLLNPTKCESCHINLEYDKRNNIFCSSKCNSEINNPVLFITDEQRIEINKKISQSIKEYNITIGKKIGPHILICKMCNIDFVSKNKKKYCTIKCQHDYRKKDMSELKKYKSLAYFKFPLNKYPNEFDFSLIEKYGWYKAKNRGDNLNGVSRDHKYSIDEGFKNKVDPLLLAHPANCRLIRHNDNVSKGSKSIITLEQLLICIKEFDIRNASIV